MQPKFLIFCVLLTVGCGHKQNEKMNSSEPIRIQVNELSSDKLLEMARLSNKLADYDSAIKYLNKAIEKDSTNAAAFFERALAWTSKDLGKSNLDYYNCIKLNFKVVDCYFGLGINYLSINDSLAVSYFEKVLEIDPNNKKARSLKQIFSKNLNSPKATI